MIDPQSSSPTRALYERARKRFPGGSSRTTLSSLGGPPYALRGEGWKMVDVDGRELIDLHGDYSALVHGNTFAPVVQAARAALESGSAFGLPTPAEVELAECLAERVGWAERWRFTGSGSEAVMAAVRAARAASGRDMVVRFAECYHGGWDALSQPGAGGVPGRVRQDVLTMTLGDGNGLLNALDRHEGEIACVLLDLMPNRAGLHPVEVEFAKLVRDKTRSRGIALIVDEVITFRMARGGMQELYGIEGDIVTLGKLIGGGLPVGALGGRAEWMDVFDPSKAGAVALAGTFAANPVSMRAGLAALDAFGPAQIERIGGLGERLRRGLEAQGYEVSGSGSLCKLHSDDLKAQWWRLYEQGVLIAADGLMSVSTAMDGAVVDRALQAFARAAR
ncbi:MAG TPA: aminotransferase class III-fold pyridoxal phosphate-dependent enzyme [Solirubrobacteraceae bacterium]